VTERGIGCEFCDWTGQIERGSGRVYIAGGEVVDDLYLVPCPVCAPPDPDEDEEGPSD
jgi:hypothetical protein